jgi:hypothetical protein
MSLLHDECYLYAILDTTILKSTIINYIQHSRQGERERERRLTITIFEEELSGNASRKRQEEIRMRRRKLKQEQLKRRMMDRKTKRKV